MSASSASPTSTSASHGLSNAELSRFIAPKTQTVCRLDAHEAFSRLTPREKLYALHFSRASWVGALASVATVSPESAGIFCLLQGLFETREARESIPGAEGGHDLMQFAAAFYGNLANYASFGDTKIVPRLPREAFRSIVAAHDRVPTGRDGGGGDNDGSLLMLFDKVAERMYSLVPGQRMVDFNPAGVTNYYGEGITREEAEAVQGILTAECVSVLNTRLFRARGARGGTSGGSAGGVKRYELLIASAMEDDDGTIAGREYSNADGSVVVRTVRGDFSRAMTVVADEIEKAGGFAAGARQEAFCRAYAEHFRTGAHEPYVESQREWVMDVSPTVETTIGFVETYLDPLGVRAEFEGMVACVNKATSAKYGALVLAAEPLIAQLPWPKFMEKEKFLKPDFTSLDVLAYANRNVYSGSNNPNLEEVRATHGFKNVTLGNVLATRMPAKHAVFLRDEDQDLYRRLQPKSLAVQIAIHELLGHGAGRLLVEHPDGTRNFDLDSATDPLTGGRITSWYHGGASWESVFTDIATAYEECRAEAVGLYLCTEPHILAIFGHTDPAEAADVAYVNWVYMARIGLLALEQYDPASGSWGQAHMHARFAILRMLLSDARGSVRVERTGEPGSPQEDVKVTVDRERLDDARTAIGNFLVRLQTFKSTGDGAKGRALFEGLTEVPEEWLALRSIVLRKKTPRSVFVQPHLESDGNGGVSLVNFDPSPMGIVESFQRRFAPGEAQRILGGYF